jgi:hypothetical protein
MSTIIGARRAPAIDNPGYNWVGISMRTSKGLAILALALLALLGIFAFRYPEVLGQKPHAVTLHWQPSPHATSYNIYRRTEDGSFSKIGSAQTPTYVDTPVPGGMVFYYGVTSLEGQQESKISTVIRVEVPKDTI